MIQEFVFDFGRSVDGSESHFAISGGYSTWTDLLKREKTGKDDRKLRDKTGYKKPVKTRQNW